MIKSNNELVDIIMKLLQLPEDKREIVLRIINEHKPCKVALAVKNAYKYTKHGKEKPIMTLEEFEQMLKRFRY